MTSPFEKLGESVAEEVDRDPLVALDAQRRLAQRARLVAEMPLRRRISSLYFAAAAMAAVALLALGLFFALDRGPAPLRCAVRGGRTLAAGDWIDAPRGEARVVDFSEGSSVKVERGARLRIFRLDAERVHLAVENGRVRSRVRKGAKWTVGAGPYSAHVIGTRFSVAWTPETRRMRVEVQEGLVRVRGVGIQAGGIEVRPGQRLDARLDSREVRLRQQPGMEEQPKDARPVPRSADAGAPQQDAAARAPKRPTPRVLDDGWRRLAKAGRYGAALSAARRAGYSRLLSRLPASDLLLLADAARLAGDKVRARRALETLRRRFRRHPASARAAFRLGRLAADRRDYAAAARWFRRFLREARPTSAFVGDARGRLMVALQRSGDLRGAREQARRYLAKHPKGPYAASARSLSGGK